MSRQCRDSTETSCLGASALHVVAVVAMVALGCGKHSGKTGEQAGGSTVTATQWTVVLPANDELPAIALIASDKERALLTADGRVLDRKPVSDPNFLRNTLRSAGTLVMISKSAILALDVASGAERWTQRLSDVPTLYGIGEKAVAIASESGVDLFDLSTGERRYHGATRPDRIYADGSEFLFLRDREVWLVDGDGHERWRADVTSTADLRLGKTSVLVLGNDGFTELGRATGDVLASGASPASGAVEAEAKTLDRDYQVVRSANKLIVVTRDAAGRQLWTAPWPREDVGTIELALDQPDRQRVALVEASTRRTLLIIDGGGGKVVSSQPLGSGDRLTALSDSCAVVLLRSTNRVVCIDPTVGRESWSIPISGEDTALWPLKGDDLLLADSNPLTLSRLDQTGRRAWQVEVPNAALAFSKTGSEKPTIIDTRGERHKWILSAGMAISTTGAGIRILDLGTGKLHEVTL